MALKIRKPMSSITTATASTPVQTPALNTVSKTAQPLRHNIRSSKVNKFVDFIILNDLYDLNYWKYLLKVQANFSCPRIKSVRKSAVPMSLKFSSAFSISLLKLLMMVS